jgi:hypothetical protein
MASQILSGFFRTISNYFRSEIRGWKHAFGWMLALSSVAFAARKKAK